MTAGSALVPAGASSVGVGVGMSSPRSGDIAAVVRALFPNAVKNIAGLFDLSIGAANKKVHGEREFRTDEIAALLQTEQGFEILVALMGNARPRWWVLCASLMDVAEAQRLQAAARRRLRRAVKGALDADEDITAAITRAEMLSDQEFVGSHVAALRASRGAPDRTVAEKRRR